MLCCGAKLVVALFPTEPSSDRRTGDWEFLVKTEPGSSGLIDLWLSLLDRAAVGRGALSFLSGWVLQIVTIGSHSSISTQAEPEKHPINQCVLSDTRFL